MLIVLVGGGTDGSGGVCSGSVHGGVCAGGVRADVGGDGVGLRGRSSMLRGCCSWCCHHTRWCWHLCWWYSRCCPCGSFTDKFNETFYSPGNI